MKIFFLIIILETGLLFGNILYTETYNQTEDGRLIAWIFFQDKPESVELNKQIVLDQKTLLRREKAKSQNTNRYDRQVSSNYLEIIQSYPLRIRQISRWLNAVSVEANSAVLEQIENLDFVRKITPLLVYKKRPLESIDLLPPSRRSVMNYTSLDYGLAQDQIEQINVHLAHEAGYFGQGIRILVMDTGFNLEHPAFDSLNVIAQRDFINDDENTANETTDEKWFGQHNHGTMVLSTMAGYAPGELIGPAFKSEFLLAKTEMLVEEIRLEEDLFVAGLEWGEAQGADVVSTSLGYLDWYTYDDLDGNTAVTTLAIDIAVGLGMVCVSAAGNEGNKAWYYIITPADADSIISVGAVDNTGKIAYFSSHGPTIDGRIKPEVCARGLYTACVQPNGTGYTSASGTSLSTPLVGGAAAVILSAHPDWDPMTVRAALMETATQAANPDNTYGYGIINVDSAIHYTPSQDKITIPNNFGLMYAYPNPFNSVTNILISPNSPGEITVSIYNLAGQLIATIFEGFVKSDITLQIDKEIDRSGIYFVNMEFEGGHETTKLILLK